MNQQSSPPQAAKIAGIVCFLIGAVLWGIPLVHGVTGFYDSDLPWMVTMLAIGAPFLWFASRVFPDRT